MIKSWETVERAMDKCIKEHILEDILTKNRQDVLDMVLTEYDEELHIENERRIAEKKADMKWQKIVDEQVTLLSEKDALLDDKDTQLEAQAQEIIRLKKLLEEKI